MSSASGPRPRLNLEQQRKRAKELRRAHREGNQEAAERILAHLPRVRGWSARQVLAAPVTLSEAQLVVAREAGFASWPQVKRAAEAAEATDPGDRLDRAVQTSDLLMLERVLRGPLKWWQIMWALKLSVELDREELARPLMARSVSRGVEPALLEAIRLGRSTSLIEVLVTAGKTPLTPSVIQAGYRAAQRWGHPEAAELLLRQGADPTRLNPVDRAISACVRGDQAELRQLMEAYTADDLQFEDHRVLSWAVRMRREGAVPLLLMAGLDPNFPDSDGDMPLHLAVRAGSLALLDQLLGGGGRVDARNLDGQRPLQVARALPDPETRQRLSQRLLDAGANAVEAPDRPDLDELFERAADAVVSGDLEGLRALLDREPALVRARSPREHRCTLLHYSGANGVEQFRQQTPPNAPAIAQLLLDRGAEVDAVCKAAGVDTPLYLLITSGIPVEAGLDGEIAGVLAAGGARIDWGDEDGPMIWTIDAGLDRTATALAEAGLRLDNLLFAAAAGRVDVLEDLLARGADVNTRYWAGYTALHAAAVTGRQGAVELLLRRGADPSLREEKYGDIALDKAVWRGHKEVVALLETAASGV